MNMKELQSIFTIGETVAVEFKRCGNGIENDTYETVCSFLNRFGGELFMGVLDDGTVVGVPEKAAPDMVKNFWRASGQSYISVLMNCRFGMRKRIYQRSKVKKERYQMPIFTGKDKN